VVWGSTTDLAESVVWGTAMLSLDADFVPIVGEPN
jgi:hypothetical protein